MRLFLGKRKGIAQKANIKKNSPPEEQSEKGNFNAPLVFKTCIHILTAREKLIEFLFFPKNISFHLWFSYTEQDTRY